MKQLERVNSITSSIVRKTSFKTVTRKLMRIGRCKNNVTGDSGRHNLSSDVLVGLLIHANDQENPKLRHNRTEMDREKSNNTYKSDDIAILGSVILILVLIDKTDPCTVISLSL